MGNFNSLIGQDALKQSLCAQIEAARSRSALLPHVLLCGPPGRGKATFAAAIADELQRPYRAADARSIGKASDLAALLTSFDEYDILGIQDIDALPGLLTDTFVPAIENYELDLIIGQGSSARSVKLDLPRFTLIGTTSKPSQVDERLVRWMISYNLKPYSDREMQELLPLLAIDHKLALAPEAAQLLARYCEGSLENASVLLKKLLNHEHHVEGYVSLKTAMDAVRLLGYQSSPTNPRDVLKGVRAMSGSEFERFVANVFQRQGYTAELTGASGDHGIDIILRKHGQVIAVQCKQWGNSIGEPVLRDFYGSILNAGVNMGFLVTSSNFTTQAETFAQNKPIKLYDIDALIQIYLDTLA